MKMRNDEGLRFNYIGNKILSIVKCLKGLPHHGAEAPSNYVSWNLVAVGASVEFERPTEDADCYST